MIDTDRKISLGGGYWLVNDSNCCWIEKEYVYKTGKRAGEKYLKRVSGYTARVEDALVSFCDGHTREFNARSVNSLIKEIKSLKSLIKQFGENYERSRHRD